MSDSQEMQQVADVLEKAAAYVAALEDENAALRSVTHRSSTKRLEKQAQELKRNIANLTGQEVSLEVAKKVASIEDKDVREIFQKISSAESADNMGSARRRTGNRAKTASQEESADEAFARWVLS